MKNIIYLSIGSNLLNPLNQVNIAIDFISKNININILKISSFYLSNALKFKNQPKYINCVLKLQTNINCFNLLKILQNIENIQGRVRTNNKWESRIIDIDILLYNNEIINEKKLIIPHYDMKNRDFILFPLYEICPDLIFPNGKIIKDLIKKLKYINYVKAIIF